MDHAPPIFVTGAARSGTSMVAGIVRAAGAWAGLCQGPDGHNPRGYHENVGLRKVVKDAVRAAGGDPVGACPLTRWWLLEAEMRKNRDGAWAMRERMLELIHGQGYRTGKRWMFKDARLLHIWPLMVSAFPDALWICCERAPEATLRSAAAFSPLVGRIPDPVAWLSYHRHAARALAIAGAKCLTVDTDRIVMCPFALQLRKVLREHCKLALSPRRLREVVDPDIWGRS